MDLSFQVDWLRFSLKDTPIYHVFPLDKNLPHISMHGPAIQALPRYNLAALMTPGGRIDYGEGEQGTLVTFTGGDLYAMRLAGVEMKEVCSHVAQTQWANVTRFDLCADIIGAGAKAQDIAEAWERGNVASRVKKMTRIESTSKGDSLGVTVYFGSRQSERFLRVYDKGLEQGEESEFGQDWLRVEMECKGRYANAAVRRVSEIGERETLVGLLRGLLTVSGVDWWDEMQTGEYSEFPELGRKQKSTSDDWLYNVALAKVIEAARQGDANVWRAIRELLDEQN